ncbi:hypothetical protein AbraIFM66950_008209 [Aspergillus brasiliensis]|nr:hypothetical protein AbraIFM66950_008209 [Aspergillus brasiliensis]
MAFILGIAVLLGALFFFLPRQSARLPPGPQALILTEILHRALSYTPQPLWIKLREWHRRYGPLVHISLAGQRAVFVGDQSAVRDLLDKRGRIYSSRPRLVMAGEIMTAGDHIVFMPYGDKWRRHHRIQGDLLSPKAVRQYRDLMDLESLKTLHDLLSTSHMGPEDSEIIFRRYFGSLINTLAYGEPTVDNGNAPQLEEVDKIAKAFANAIDTGNWLVDSFPILKRLPSWIAPFRRYGEQIHDETVKLFRAKTNAALKKGGWNWVTHTKNNAEQMDEHEFLYVIGVLYQAGVHVSVAALRHFLVACQLHPSAVDTAQQEINSVLGPTQNMPGLDDLARLPYTSAFFREVMRWRPLTPIGAPHALVEDDDYQGYHLPRGTLIMPNHWELDLNDGEFRPERWLTGSQPPVNVFGFGRRICPGRHLAEDALSLLMTRMLWAFKFEAPDPIDPWGFEIDASILVPHHSRALITARDRQKSELLNRTWEAADKDVDAKLQVIGEKLSV